jgi:D-3-phosphoglycerate dehydrogenase / 2-oxoglutarate reductase
MPTAAQDIPVRNGHGAEDDLSRTVSNSFNAATLSSSPTATFHRGLSGSPSATFHHSPHSHRSGSIYDKASAAKPLTPFNTQDIKVLLLENVNVTGQEILRKQGYQVEAIMFKVPRQCLA